MQVTITSNAAEINRRLSNMVARQLPYAIAKGLNDTAKTLVAKNKQDMKLAFRNPVPYTLNAFYFRYAKKGETSVTIQRKEKPAGKHYLEVQERGGVRPRKAFETKYMHRIPFEGPINFITPTRAAPTLKSGHLSMGFMEKVTHQLNLSNDKAMQANTQRPKTRKSRGKQYFVPDINHPLGQGIRAGVYERSAAGNAKKVLNFATKVPTYKKRFHFHEKMPKYAAHILPAKMNNALAHAIRTARL